MDPNATAAPRRRPQLYALNSLLLAAVSMLHVGGVPCVS